MHLLMFSQDDQSAWSAARFWRAVALLALIALAAGIGYRTIYFVDETQFVYVTQFGQPLRLHSEAGLGLKWPYQSLWRFDRRLQMYQPPAREMLTKDKENLTFDWYVCWRIAGPDYLQQHHREQHSGEPTTAWLAAEQETLVRRFLQSIGDPRSAENRLEERIQSALAAEIGQTRMDQLVNLEADQVELDQITRRVYVAIRQAAVEQFGIEVVDVRLNRITYPQAVRPAVFAEIRSERQRVAVQYRAEGASQKARIESLADLQRDQLMAQAGRDAAVIRSEGEAKSIELLNAAHSQNPQFYELLKTLETYRSILDDQTTVVLSADSPLLKLLMQGLPPLMDHPLPGTKAADLTTPDGNLDVNGRRQIP